VETNMKRKESFMNVTSEWSPNEDSVILSHSETITKVPNRKPKFLFMFALVSFLMQFARAESAE